LEGRRDVTSTTPDVIRTKLSDATFGLVSGLATTVLKSAPPT